MWNSSFRHLSFIYSFSFFPLRSPCSLQTTMAKSPWLSSPITTATSGNSLPFFLGYTSASCVLCLCCNFFFFFWKKHVSMTLCHTSGSHALFTGSTTSFFSNFFIKIGSHGIMHTFKNYFTTILSVFNKISGIQTDPYSNSP